MLIRLKNSLGRIIKATALLTFFIGLALVSSFKQAELRRESATVRAIQSPDNISDSLSHRESRAVRRSRNSAVNVMSAAESGIVSSASGTYFRIDDRYYVITVSHAIIGDCEAIRITTEEDMVECIEMVAIDRHTDYAIMQVDRIPGRTPIDIINNSPGIYEWKDRLAIQEKVYYTGYPNGLGPLTFGGSIVGHDVNENIYLHSFAWPGSSGSGVFSETGDLIGMVIAISVGATDIGLDVLEDIVIIIPLYKIHWGML